MILFLLTKKNFKISHANHPFNANITALHARHSLFIINEIHDGLYDKKQLNLDDNKTKVMDFPEQTLLQRRLLNFIPICRIHPNPLSHS